MGRKQIKDVLDGPPPQASSYVMNLPQPPARNAEEYLRAYVGYVYTAVSAITQEVASIDLHLYSARYTRKGIETNEVFEHPILSVLNYANELYTLYDLIEATQTYDELTGESFWVVTRDQKGMPRDIWPIRPDWVKVIPSPTNIIDHYDYFAGGVQNEKVSIPRENVIHFKYLNPLNPFRGKGPTQAAALPFDILNFAGEYNRNFFFNSAIPSMVFSTDQKVSEQTIKRFLEQWQASFGGRAKSNKVAFLGNGMKMEKASFGAKELDFNEQMKQMRDDVLAVFKVPKTVLGLTEDVNRANAEATTRAFMERVITPRMRKFVNTLNEFYVPMFDTGGETLFLDFTDPAPEDVELKLKKYESGRTYNWLTPNEIRIQENLEPLPGGDDLFPVTNSQQGNENTNGTNASTNTPTQDTSEQDQEGKGWRSTLIKLLGGTVNKELPIYTPPAYLLTKKRVKHMVRIPVKRLEKIEEEQLAASFTEPLKKFISQLIAHDTYAPLKKGRSKELRISDVVTKAMKEVEVRLAKEKEDKEKKEQKEQEALKKGSGLSEEDKVSTWNAFIRRITNEETSVQEVCQKVFTKQEKIVLANIELQFKAWRKFMGRKANIEDILPPIDDLDSMWKSLEGELEQLFIAQGNRVLSELDSDADFNITTEYAKWYLEEYSGILISGIDTTTLQALRTTLAEGFDKGEGAVELSQRVQEVFSVANEVRALAIARSEVIRATNTASVEAYRQSGVVSAKEWLAERDKRACPYCLKLDGKVVGLNTNFLNKGDTMTVTDEEGNEQTMKFDYVAVGEPPAHTQCRCTVLPVIVTEE